MICNEIQKKDIIQFLNKLNQDIEDFIKNSIEVSSAIKTWSDLHKGFKPLRCWEVKGCSKKDCPAYENEDYRCWLIAGTLCKGEVQGEFAKKYGDCFKCDVFKALSKEPCRELYENIDILIFHLQDKAVKFREIAVKDQLTGLYNRHFFNEIIERELAGTERRDEYLSFIMIDMDNFKDINDTLGHLTGDKLLVEAANLIKNTVRKADLVFRFGGDEFLVLLMNADKDRADYMVKRLLERVDRWNEDNASAYGCRLSFSIGASTCGKDCDVHVALNEADERMYQSKKEKRGAE